LWQDHSQLPASDNRMKLRYLPITGNTETNGADSIRSVATEYGQMRSVVPELRPYEVSARTGWFFPTSRAIAPMVNSVLCLRELRSLF
jgi:hypothetical protein